jgi:hypothetical protein
MPELPVTMYTAPGRLFCEQAKAWLSEAGIHYTGIGTILHSGLSFDRPSASPSIARGYEPRHYLAHLLPSGDLGRFSGSDVPPGVIP